MQEKYNVVLSGRHPAADPNEVAQKLASLFKCTVEQAGHLLSQPSCVVKKSVAEEAADKYKKAIENTGAQCIIQAIPQEAPLDFDVAPTLSPSIGVAPVAGAPVPVPSTPQAAPAIQERAATASALSRQEAIQIFVGKNHDYFERKWAVAAQKKNQLSWNWAAFLAGFGWMGFRKMYLYSWIFIGVVTVEMIAELAIGVPSAISNGVNFGIAIFFGRKANAWYKQHVDQRVDQILASHSPDQARIELARQGGTNIGAAAGFVAALFVLLVMIGVIAEG